MYANYAGYLMSGGIEQDGPKNMLTSGTGVVQYNGTTNRVTIV